MGKKKILLVDDDMLFGQIAVKVLQAADYEVFYQNTLFGIESLIMKLHPSIIILDVMIGEENSLERINDIRIAAEDIPIIFISSFSEIEYKAKAAKNGAMIYLEKPFDKDELLMWVDRYAKKNEDNDARMINVGDYSIDLDTHELSYRGYEERTLSNTEFATFKMLFVNKGEMVSRHELKDAVWSGLNCTDENLNNVIYKLRRYFSKDSTIHLETMRKEGFKMWINRFAKSTAHRT